MKKLLLTLTFIAGMTVSTSAALNGDGFYRIKNYMTERYLYVLDNRADVDMGATTVDMNGVELWKGVDRMISDPATVVYIKKVGNDYDILAQGTGIHAMSDLYLKLRADSKTGTYYAYGTQSGVTKYLGDPRVSPRYEQSYLGDNATGDYRKWYIIPVSLNEDEYFGVQPTIECEGTYYQPFYADFDFAPVSSNTKAYYVSQIDKANAIAVITEFKDGKAPATCPMIISCKSNKPADNKLNVGAGASSKPTDNLLAGNYFDNAGEGGHYNRTRTNKSTMRMLGVTAAGKLGYVEPTVEFLPRNQSYLKVDASCPAELTVMTEAEYAEFMADAPMIEVDAANGPVIYYNLQGIEVTEPQAGQVVIRRQGAKATKVIIK